MPTRPNTLEVLTITPSFCSTRIGRKARVPLTTPPKLIRRSHSSSPGSASSTEEATATPALLNTAASGAVSHSRTSAAKRTWSSASRTSRTRVSTCPGSDRAVCSRPASSMSAMATGEPDRDRRWARLRPMPEAAPVIITGRPVMTLRLRGIGTPCQSGADVSAETGARTAMHYGAAAPGGRKGDAPGMPPLVAVVRRLEREVAKQRPQHHVHLHLGEGGADAPPGAAAKRDPLVGVGPAAQEAVGVKALGAREHGLVVVGPDRCSRSLPALSAASTGPAAW